MLLILYSINGNNFFFCLWSVGSRWVIGLQQYFAIAIGFGLYLGHNSPIVFISASHYAASFV